MYTEDILKAYQSENFVVMYYKYNEFLSRSLEKISQIELSIVSSSGVTLFDYSGYYSHESKTYKETMQKNLKKILNNKKVFVWESEDPESSYCGYTKLISKHMGGEDDGEMHYNYKTDVTCPLYLIDDYDFSRCVQCTGLDLWEHYFNYNVKNVQLSDEYDSYNDETGETYHAYVTPIEPITSFVEKYPDIKFTQKYSFRENHCYWLLEILNDFAKNPSIENKRDFKQKY